MLPQAPRGGRVVEGRVLVEQQGQPRAGDVELWGAVLADEAFAVCQLLRGKGRAMGRRGARATMLANPGRS